MYLHGKFVSRLGEVCQVHILTGNDRTEEVEIGAEGSGVYFAEDPAEVNCEINDTFDHLVRHSATINLLCADFMEAFFCNSARDAIVNIYKGIECVFAGFIEPQTYSQTYNEVLDELELNCIDAVSALQYSNYKNIGSLGVSYEAVKAAAEERSCKALMVEILDGVASSLDIVNNTKPRYLYDGSRKASKASTGCIFDELALSELLFLGDEEDDTWTQDTVSEEMLRYLNLHVTQHGFTFYFFAWETLKNDSDVSWQDIEDANTVYTSIRKSVKLENSNAVDCDTQLSVGDTYNQIKLTCDIDEIENVIESPLDDDLLISPFANKQKYLTEYSADGEGKTAYNAFYKMTHDETTDYEDGTITNWFLQVMNNTEWTFPKSGDTSVNLVDYFCSEGKDQQNLPNWLASNPGAALLSFGKVQIQTSKNDNSPTSKVSMGNALVISVNGNEVDNDESRTYPSADIIKANIPYAIYNGNTAGGTFSPSDDDTTNYIVFSGKIILNPVYNMTNTYKILKTKEWGKDIYVFHQTVPSRNNDDGRYYTRQYFKAEKPADDTEWDEDTSYGFMPFTDEGPEQYEYKYSAAGDSDDKISKVAAVCCMLIIGDKVLVEKQPGEDLGTGVPGTGNGQLEDFVWCKYKSRSECADDDEYYLQSFNIGFDPKIGDCLVGTEFDIQNNIDYTKGIDAEGIGVPIKKSDKVSGKVQFMILGPTNTVWGEITRRHPSFWRHTKWGENDIPLLAHVSSIMLSEFEVKVYSDSGLLNTGQTSNDIVYLSDTKENFVNKKDDITFKISSALTTAECQALGVGNTVNKSTPLDATTGAGVLTVYDAIRKVEAKPEQMYVDSYYTEYHKPRVQLEQNITDISGVASPFYHYIHPALNKEFYVIGYGRNLIEGSASLRLKEIWND